MEEDEHEEYLEALAYAAYIFDGEAEVEGGARLTVELRYLTVYLGEVVVVVGEEPACPASGAGDAGEEADGAECHAVAVAPDEEVDAECAEECGEGKDDGDGCVEWQEMEGCEHEIYDDGGCPKAEVGKDVHHGEEENRGCGSLHSDMGCELDYLIGFASEESDGCGVVERKARDCDSQEVEEGDGTGSAASQDDMPRPCIHQVEYAPEGKDGDEPVACLLDVSPELGEADVEGEYHHDDCDDSDEEEYVFEFQVRN